MIKMTILYAHLIPRLFAILSGGISFSTVDLRASFMVNPTKNENAADMNATKVFSISCSIGTGVGQTVVHVDEESLMILFGKDFYHTFAIVDTYKEHGILW